MLSTALSTWQYETGYTYPEKLTPDYYDRKTGERLLEEFHWGEMPRAALGADTITKPESFLDTGLS